MISEEDQVTIRNMAADSVAAIRRQQFGEAGAITADIGSCGGSEALVMLCDCWAELARQAMHHIPNLLEAGPALPQHATFTLDIDDMCPPDLWAARYICAWTLADPDWAHDLYFSLDYGDRDIAMQALVEITACWQALKERVCQ